LSSVFGRRPGARYRSGQTRARGPMAPREARALIREMIRVLIVDDRPEVRFGLKMRLALEPDIDVVGEAGDAWSAVVCAVTLCPDVVLMDIVMPGMDSLAATSVLQALEPRMAVVVLTLEDDAKTRSRAQAAGASAFVAKREADALLVPAIRRAASARA
jgi:DNA-binding NarL/FixJ family response regulator